MKQHVVHDQVAVRYADGVDHVWTDWEPSLRRCERIFGPSPWRMSIDGDDIAEQIRRSQYRAHTAAEFAAGLVPPPSAHDAHAVLLGTLAACRDALGVLAIRAELDELDDEMADVGLQTLELTRDAFRGARSTTALVQAWTPEEQVDPRWLHEDHQPSRVWPALLWGLVAACTLLFVLLVAQVLITGAPS
jgi:hypothetical protein